MVGGAPPARRLDEYLTSLSMSNPEVEPVDSNSVVDMLANSRVVGLGEATHGTHEFFELRRQVLRLLVEELDFRLFGLEAGLAETLAVDDYVVHGNGDPRAALTSLDLWPWNVEEMLALIEWIRRFNADRPAEDRVRFYGFDAQFVEKSAAAVREYLSTVDPGFLAAIDDRLRSLESKTIRGQRYNVAEEHIHTAESTTAALIDRFERLEGDYVAETSRDAYDLVRRQLRTLEQATDFASASYEANEPHGAVNLRDEYMAENAAWVLDHERTDRIVLWAHNGHLMKGGTDGGLWEEFTPMGHHLATRFDDDYCMIGTDFDHGSFLATPDPLDVDDPEPRPFTVGRFRDTEPSSDEPWASDRSVNSVLSEFDSNALFFDVTAAADDPALSGWLERRHLIRDIGTAFWDESSHLGRFRLPAEMDGLLYVTESTPTTLLDGEETD